MHALQLAQFGIAIVAKSEQIHVPETQQRALCKNEWPQHSLSRCGLAVLRWCALDVGRKVENLVALGRLCTSSSLPPTKLDVQGRLGTRHTNTDDEQSK
jgi:hypothetical protein